jgi:hypothetical protein
MLRHNHDINRLAAEFAARECRFSSCRDGADLREGQPLAKKYCRQALAMNARKHRLAANPF